MKVLVKRLLFLCSFLVLFPNITAYAFLKEYGNFKYAIKNYAERGDENRFGACVYHYIATDSNANLVFPDEIEGYPVLEIRSGTVSNTDFFSSEKVRDGIREVSIPASVEVMGYAFKYCKSLETVFFEGNNLKEIRPFTFAYCTNLNSINLPEGIEEINGEAFWKCDSLEEFVIPSTVKYLGTSSHTDFKDHVVSGKALRRVVNLSDNEFPINAIWIPGYEWYLDENGRQKATSIPANSTLYAIKRNKKPVSDSGSSDNEGDSEAIPKKKLNLEDLSKIPGLHTIELPARDGEWKFHDGKWMFKRSDGQYAKAQWVFDDQKWYIIGADGYMFTGWQQINGKWYYFEISGTMLSDCYTPDGYYVNSDGEWIEGVEAY